MKVLRPSTGFDQRLMDPQPRPVILNLNQRLRF